MGGGGFDGGFWEVDAILKVVWGGFMASKAEEYMSRTAAAGGE